MHACVGAGEGEALYAERRRFSAVGVNVQRVLVLGEQGKPSAVSLRDRAAWPVADGLPWLKFLEKPSIHFCGNSSNVLSLKYVGKSIFQPPQSRRPCRNDDAFQIQIRTAAKPPKSS